MIRNEIGAVFVPVTDIEAAKDWYRDILGIEQDLEILFGHLCVVPMRDGSGLALDSEGFVGPHDRKPLFHFNTDDLQTAHRQLVDKGVTIVDGLTGEPFFTFKDPDGNLLMVADVPPAPRAAS